MDHFEAGDLVRLKGAERLGLVEQQVKYANRAALRVLLGPYPEEYEPQALEPAFTSASQDYAFALLVANPEVVPTGRVLRNLTLAQCVELMDLLRGPRATTRLLELLTTSRPPGDEVGEYIRVQKERELITRHAAKALSKDFAVLKPEDLYLAACYASPADRLCLAPSDPSQLASWKIDRVLRSAPDERSRNMFLVKAMQPRIAELLFKELYERLHPEAELEDLNIESVRAWGTYDIPCQGLPGWDLQSSEGHRFDVKSNLFFRGKHADAARGFMGFYIDLRRDPDIHQGIVFYGASDTGCYAQYVGELDWRSFDAWQSQRRDGVVVECGRRASPFLFCFPDPLRPRYLRRDGRTELSVSQPSELVLRDWRIAMTWILGAADGTRGRVYEALCSQNERVNPVAMSFLGYLARGLDHDQGWRFAEFVLWESVTRAAFESSIQGRVGRGFLEEIADALDNPSHRPTHLTQIGAKGLLSRWISSVLTPIAQHGPSARCPICDQCLEEMIPLRMSARGAVLGTLTCMEGHRTEEVTLLTPCGGGQCGEFPLIIGKESTCSLCLGLKCGVCGCCKC